MSEREVAVEPSTEPSLRQAERLGDHAMLFVLLPDVSWDVASTRGVPVDDRDTVLDAVARELGIREDRELGHNATTECLLSATSTEVPCARPGCCVSCSMQQASVEGSVWMVAVHETGDVPKRQCIGQSHADQLAVDLVDPAHALVAREAEADGTPLLCRAERPVLCNLPREDASSTQVVVSPHGLHVCRSPRQHVGRDIGDEVVDEHLFATTDAGKPDRVITDVGPDCINRDHGADRLSAASLAHDGTSIGSESVCYIYQKTP